MTAAVECYAELEFNQNQLAAVAAPVDGLVRQVNVDLGDRVEEGTPLAALWSAEIGEAVARAVLARQTVVRERRLRADRISTEQDLQAAEAADQAVRQQLRALGFTDDQVAALGEHADTDGALMLRAPFAGEIVTRNVVRGEMIKAGQNLFTVADRSTMWAILNIPERELARVAVGQVVELQTDAVPGEVFRGRLTWIAPSVDERTRLARARAELPNPEARLRAKLFARARILTQPTAAALVVPHSAVQSIGNRPFVFVKLADDLFEARHIELGVRHNGDVEVVNGLQPDEPIVVANGFAAKSQFLISRLGAGCADH